MKLSDGSVPPRCCHGCPFGWRQGNVFVWFPCHRRKDGTLTRATLVVGPDFIPFALILYLLVGSFTGAFAFFLAASVPMALDVFVAASFACFMTSHLLASCRNPGLVDVPDRRNALGKNGKEGRSPATPSGAGGRSAKANLPAPIFRRLSAALEDSALFEGEDGSLRDEENQLSFLPGPGAAQKQCAPCAILVPIDAVHCDRCGVCVRHHDHHCPWVGQCIAEGNMNAFWAFLASLASLFISLMVSALWAGFAAAAADADQFRERAAKYGI